MKRSTKFSVWCIFLGTNFGVSLYTDMSVIYMPRLLWYAASSISLPLQEPKTSILSSKYSGRMAGRCAPPFGILIR